MYNQVKFMSWVGAVVMGNNITAVIQSIKDTNNPTIKGKQLSFFIADSLKAQTLHVYEAYLLQWEVINYMREGYILPAWNGRVQISTCIALLNQKLLALAFHDINCVKQLEEWGKEALRLCVEKRNHYIMDRYDEFINMRCDDIFLLKELLTVREKYKSLSDGEGPYHVEVFPYHYIEPERILLEKRELPKEKNISADIEIMLIALNT